MEIYRFLLYRWLELRWSRKFRAVVVCSEADKEYLVTQGVRRAVVVPNTVSAQEATSDQPGLRAHGRRHLRLAFLGNLADAPSGRRHFSRQRDTSSREG